MRIDTRIKLIVFVLVNICIFGLKNLLLGCIGFMGVCILCILMGQRIRVRKYIIAYLTIVAISYGCVILPVGLMSFVSIIALFVRVMLPVGLFASTFVETTTVSELISAMYSMHIPKSIVITFAMTLRFFPTFGEEMERIYDAMKLRGMGVSVKNIFTKPLMMFEAVLIPLIMRSSTIAEELSASAVTRGIDNPQIRTSFNEMKISVKDIALLGIVIVYGTGLFVMKYYIYGRI